MNIAACLLAILASTATLPALAANLTLTPAAQDAAVLYDWTKQRCDQTDIPDAPPRAFRDYHQTVHLFATHNDNRPMVGPDFAHLKHSCQVVYQGRHDDDPSHFDDRQWLTSFSTTDGRTIQALVHDEFHAYLRPTLCPSGSYFACWYNALTLAVSTDGGASFHEAAGSAKLVAATPYRYTADFGRPVGYFQPTNMVRKDGQTYVMFLATQIGAQPRAACLARTATPADPTSWRGWDGHAFRVSFANPYLSTDAPASHVCADVAHGRTFEMGSLTYDTTSGLFVMISSVAHGGGNSIHPPGVYVTTSPDLLTWSDAKLLLDEATLLRSIGGGPYHFGFFSLIDEASDSLDFSTIAATPSLFLYYVTFDERALPWSRRLSKRAITLARSP